MIAYIFFQTLYFFKKKILVNFGTPLEPTGRVGQAAIIVRYRANLSELNGIHRNPAANAEIRVRPFFRASASGAGTVIDFCHYRSNRITYG